MLHYNQDKTMKSKKLLIALAGCAAFVATACHGDLDIIQDNQLTASNMWTESSDVTTSAYGIYYLMRANFVQDKVNVFYWGEARVGEYNHVERFMREKYNLSDIPFSALTLSFIQDYDSHLRTDCRLSPGTIINLTVQLKIIVGEAVADGIIRHC